MTSTYSLTPEDLDASARAHLPMLVETFREIAAPSGVLRSGGPAMLVSPTGDRVALPPEMFELLAGVSQQLMQGNGVRVLAMEQELTTVEAAELLNVSRPHLIKLLEEGHIPFRMVGTHRRVLLADLLRYMEGLSEVQRAAVREHARESQDLGLDF